ncbi:MAG: hypothetical protein FWF24_04095 [Alphaproteobacteria bacterium]|nr:hypothetical protein [Alphaproteobacteria bacterium]
MRFLSPIFLCAFGLLALSSLPALAGTVEYTDLRGRWVSTNCPDPQPPALAPRDSESKADAINRAEKEKLLFAEQLRAQMACLSQEAQRDIEAIGLLITQSAQAQINQIQANWAALAATARAPATE